MSAPPSLRRATFDKAVIGLFLAAIAAPSIDQLVRSDEVRAPFREQRKAAPKPKLALDPGTLNHFPERYERLLQRQPGLARQALALELDREARALPRLADTQGRPRQRRLDLLHRRTLDRSVARDRSTDDRGARGMANDVRMEPRPTQGVRDRVRVRIRAEQGNDLSGARRRALQSHRSHANGPARRLLVRSLRPAHPRPPSGVPRGEEGRQAR